MSACTESIVTDILEIGRNLLICGAEVGRVEDTITRLLHAYGAERADVLAILSNIEVTAFFPGEAPVTRLVRIKVSDYDSDFEALEKWNDLSRSLCSGPLPAEERKRLMTEIAGTAPKKRDRNIRQAAGYMLAAAGFSVFFGGTFRESAFTLLAALALFFCEKALGMLRLQKFLKVFLLSLVTGFLSVGGEVAGLNPGPVAIGLVMLLITGAAVTTSIRDMLTGETISGTLRMIESLLTACFVGAGLATAMVLSGNLFSGSGMTGFAEANLMQLVSAFAGSAGFALVFRAARKRTLLCAFGGMLSWGVCILFEHWTGSTFMANLIAGAAGTLFAEFAAHTHKLPALIPLMCSIIPLVPGRTLYLTMEYMVKSDAKLAAYYAAATAVIAAAIAAGMVLATAVIDNAARFGTKKKNAFRGR